MWSALFPSGLRFGNEHHLGTGRTTSQTQVLETQTQVLDA